jgi:drug/metabolite transporter (DMT)-like permease
MKTYTVYGLVTISAFFWGANFVLAGPVLADLTPLWAAALRFVLGASLMLAITQWRGETLLDRARQNFWIYVLLGAVGIGAFNVLFFFALQHTSAANASLIMATNPLLTTIIAAVLLGERPGMRQLAGIPLAFLGVVVVLVGGKLSRLTSMHIASGDLLMLLANLSWAFYNVLGRRYMPKGSPLANTTLVMLAGAVLLLVVALASGATLVLPGPKAMSALALMTVGGTVLAYLFWTTGIARLGASRTSLFLNLVPVFAMLIVALSGALPSMAQLTGGMLVLGGVSLTMLPQRKLAMA